MADPTPSGPDSVRFGRTTISIVVGELVDQPVAAIVTPGNQRAMFAAGPSGTLWSAAGEDVERELRAKAPFEIGSAHFTSAGRLAERGIDYIIHAIIAAGLGERPRKLQIQPALESSFEIASSLRVRSVAIPILGVSATERQEERIETARIVLETLVAHLRAQSHRIERGILVSRFEDDRLPLQALLNRVRERLWTG